MKNYGFILFLLLALASTPLFAYQAEVKCKTLDNNEVLRIYKYPTTTTEKIVNSCLSFVNMTIKFEKGREYSPDEIKPVFNDLETGKDFIPTREMDVYECIDLGKTGVVDNDYLDPSKYVAPSVLDTFPIWYSGEQRYADKARAFDRCLTIGNLHLSWVEMR